VRIGSGVGCVHPWPELGDPRLDDILENLEEHQIGRRTLACIKADGAAREAGVSLFEDVTVPRSHATMTTVGTEELREARVAGFKHIKVKVGQYLSEVRDVMRRNQDLTWRLDCNGQGHPRMFAEWTQEERDRLDFVEDPFPYNDLAWRGLGVTLATDRFKGQADVRILKPAVDNMLPSDERVVVTSYMDHPIGQSFAAWEAARMGIADEICGLQTHCLFEKNEFIEALGPWGPEFLPAGGTGLGFDDLLETLPWEKL